MKPFFRIARGLLRYPAALSVSVGCSLAVALLWGGNIGAVYPLIEVCLRGKAVQEWIADDIEIAVTRRDQMRLKLADPQPPGQQLTPAKRSGTQAEIESLERSIDFRRRILPYATLLPTTPFATVVFFIALLLAATALKNLFVVGNLVSTARAAQRTTVDLQNEYTGQILSLDLASYDRFGTSQLVTHFTESIEHVSRALYVLLGASIREPLKMLSCAVGASLISWRLMLLTLFVAPPTALLIGSLSRKIRRTLKAHVTDSVHLNRLIFQSVISLPTVQAYGMESEMREQVDKAGLERMRRAIKTSLWIALTKPVTELAGIVAVGVALIGGAYLVLNQETHLFGIRMTEQPLTIGSMLVFFGMMVGMSDPARKLTDIYSNLQIGIAAAEKVSEVLDEPSQLSYPQVIQDTTDAVARSAASTRSSSHSRLALSDNARGGIQFLGVGFKYRADQTVLDDLSLTIAPGETVCFVGPNGCGKSTLAKLLLRFYDPTAGKLLIDGIDSRQRDPKEIRKLMAIVNQTPALIEDSVAANIRFGSPAATDEQVAAAATMARADEFIQELDGQYACQIGFDGNRLSGGQKQRIALARAFLRDPEILILDEATNQIDRHSERLIFDALREFADRRTCVIVSHRPEAFELCNRIVVMEQGRITAIGSAEELLETCRTFRQCFGTHSSSEAA